MAVLQFSPPRCAAMLSNGHAGVPDEETQLPTGMIQAFDESSAMTPEYLLGAAMGDDGDGEGEYLPRLLRAWMNERSAPELLPFEFQLIQDTIELLQNQVSIKIPIPILIW